MPTDNVRTLPWVFRADLEANTAAVDVLTAALADNLRDVAIVGRTVSGEIVAYSSNADIDAVIGLLVRGTTWLAERQQVADKDDTP